MKRFYFRIYQAGDEDGSTVWVMANTVQEAEHKIVTRYHSIDRLYFIRYE